MQYPSSPTYWKVSLARFAAKDFADLLNLDLVFRRWAEPNNHCCSRTGLCGEGLEGREDNKWMTKAAGIEPHMFEDEYRIISDQWLLYYVE